MSDAHTVSRPVYLIDGRRTPFLKARGKPGPFNAVELARQAGASLLLRQPFDPNEIDQVIVGCVMPGAAEANIARIAALRLGCGERTPAWTVQRNCASGLQAIDCGFREIQAGRAHLILVGGVEAMSHAPLLLREPMIAWLANWRHARSLTTKLRLLLQLRPTDLSPLIALRQGLHDPVVRLSMGQTAEIIAQRFGIARAAMDHYAVRSHARLANASREGRLDKEISPLFDSRGQVYAQDDGLREDTTMARLAELPPVFEPHDGDVTAGNSAQITDGAAWVLLADEQTLAALGLTPLARLIDCQWAALDPSQMGLGPVHAVAKLLKKNRLQLNDIDYWEINEAFAAQVLACQTALNDDEYCRTEVGETGALGAIDMARLNVDGGGISLGHPVGASGARITLHLARVLAARRAQRGVATLCIGGGQGGALLIERESAA